MQARNCLGSTDPGGRAAACVSHASEEPTSYFKTFTDCPNYSSAKAFTRATYTTYMLTVYIPDFSEFYCHFSSLAGRPLSRPSSQP